MIVNKADIYRSVSIKGENLLNCRPIFGKNPYVKMLFKSVKTTLYSKY